MSAIWESANWTRQFGIRQTGNRQFRMLPYGTDEYFESWGRGHNIYLTSKYRGQQRIFFHCYLKSLGATTPSSAA